MNAKGFVHKYPDNVDTDVIIPARYLNTSDPKELAAHCMEDIDTEFVKKVRPGDIMVAGFNFGCGSSREHAPLVIKTCGVSCVIAKTFARIFYRNAINIGLPILECPAAAEAIQDGDEVSVDLEKNIAVIRGDCSSPEIVTQALRVLDKIAQKHGHTFTYTEVDMGGAAIDKYGDPLPQSELDKCLASDSVLLGAIGGPKWEGMPGDKRPEKGLLRLRSGMGLYANNRPAKIWPQLADASPLKPEIVAKGIDFIVVRELIGGVYFGEHRTDTVNGEQVATDTMPYSEHEIERIGRIGFETAMKRRKKLCCVDKANVLDTSRLWRAVMHRLQKEYPEVEYSEMFVDNCAMQICKNPSQFDVIVTENMFGDILSDEASEITGSIGMVPSSSLGATTCGLYEPIHGSAPDIMGQNKINPIACILSAAMMLRYSFDMAAEADEIEAAVNAVLDDGIRTADMMSEGCTLVGTREMGDAILAKL